jgi:uncharacterized membrane protein YtjA (UPF0391 family)
LVQREQINPFGAGPERASVPSEVTMLYWALVFFIIAIVAAFLGFGGVAFAAAGVAKILFFIFLVLFIVSLLANVARRA